MINIVEKWKEVEGLEEMPAEKIIPDCMDWKKVWDHYVETDPGSICGAYTDEWPSISKIRKLNAHLSQSMGVLNWLGSWGVVVDIGAGFNALNLHLTKDHEYIPVDVKQYTAETLLVDGNGDIPNIPDEYADFVICCNVFQHLPFVIQQNYIQESFRILNPTGMMFLATNIDHPGIPHNKNVVGNRRYAVTDEYFVPMTTRQEFIDMIENKFDVIVKTHRGDGFSSYWMRKAKVEP